MLHLTISNGSKTLLFNSAFAWKLLHHLKRLAAFYISTKNYFSAVFVL